MITIIVPIYNASKYLRQCLDTLHQQSYKKIEILLINDGSTDNSEMICKEFVKKDSRFKYIFKKNGGVSSARNVGIEQANGDYIIFVDSDDFCDNKMLDYILPRLTKRTLLCFGYFRVFRNKQEKETLNASQQLNINKNIYKYIIDSESIGGYACNKVFDAQIIKKYRIKFNEEIHSLEDMLFVIEYTKHITEIKYIEAPLYFYRMRKSSVSNDLFNSKNLSMLEALKILIQRFKKNDKISMLLKYNYLYNYYRLKSKSKEEKNMIVGNEKEFIKQLDKRKQVKIYIVKHFHFIYRIVWKIRTYIQKLYN